MTLAAGPDAWQGAMSAGLLAWAASWRAVPSRPAATSSRCWEASRKPDSDLDTDRRQEGQAWNTSRARKQKVPGLGHPQHNSGDPRANVLLGIRRQSAACRATTSLPSAPSPNMRLKS